MAIDSLRQFELCLSELKVPLRLETWIQDASAVSLFLVDKLKNLDGAARWEDASVQRYGVDPATALIAAKTGYAVHSWKGIPVPIRVATLAMFSADSEKFTKTSSLLIPRDIWPSQKS